MQHDKFLTTAFALLLGATSLLADADPGKNLLRVRYRDLPQNTETLLQKEPGSWDFNFRPYGSDAGVLWSDPSLQRDVISGGQSEKRLTAINVSCNERGFTLLVFSSEPSLTDALAKTNSIPSPSIELFFSRGDADTPKIEHHYQMVYSQGLLREFPWLERDRHFRPCLPFTTCEEKILPNGFLIRFSFDWEPLFDRLPLDKDKRDNFWRLTVIRWADGGQTWGGVVHQPNQAGYIRWPDFTQEQKTAIREHLLQRGWSSFRQLSSKPAYNAREGWGGIPICKAPYRLDELKETPRTYVNFGEDPGFRPVLEKLTAERNALGPEIARFREMSPAEQKAFYDKASDMLFNFAYDVQAAFADYKAEKIFSMK